MRHGSARPRRPRPLHHVGPPAPPNPRPTLKEVVTLAVSEPPTSYPVKRPTGWCIETEKCPLPRICTRNGDPDPTCWWSSANDSSASCDALRFLDLVPD